MNITQTILQFRIKWCSELNCTPQQINTGNCEGFAAEIEERGFEYATWGSEIPYEGWLNSSQDWIDSFSGCHCFIDYNGRYYDSECPQGCIYPDDLPFYKRLKEIKTF